MTNEAADEKRKWGWGPLMSFCLRPMRSRKSTRVGYTKWAGASGAAFGVF